VLAADAARSVTEAERLGVHARLDRVDWPGIRDRVFGRIDPIHDSAVAYRRSKGVDVYTEPARFVSPRVIEVGTETMTAHRIVVAAGSRPTIPDVRGLDTVGYHTSDTIMRIAELPRSMVVLGGGFVAAEMGRSLVDAPPGKARISVVTLTELTVGIHAANDQSMRSLREATLAKARSFVAISYDEALAPALAKLVFLLRSEGRRVPLADAIIAATALVHDLTVWTQDNDFEVLAELEPKLRVQVG